MMTLLVALVVLGRGAAAVAESRVANASDLDAYFSLAASIWSPKSAAGKCLEQQRREGFAKKGSGSNFKTVGVEGVGHHWLEALPRDLCGGGGKLRRCGGQASFSACGGCCKVSTKGGRVEYGKAPQRARRGHAWRCFEGDSPNYPKLDKARHHVVLVRDVTSTLESILRRFWIFDERPGGQVDTLAREEAMLRKGMGALEARLPLDCRRTLYLSFDLARRFPDAHAAALAAFLGASPSHAGLRKFLGARGAGAPRPAAAAAEAVDCVKRNAKLLPRLRSYVAWLRDRTSNDTLRDSGCAESMAPVVAACGAGSDGDCVAAFRARFDKCAAGLRRRYSTAAATTGLTTCL